MGAMIHKRAEVKRVDRELHRFSAIASAKAVDRDGEVILPRAFEGRLETFMQNPVITWAHDQRRPPVGKVIATKISDEAFTFEGEFASKESAFAKEVEALYAGGFLNAFSVGFMPHTVSDEPVLAGQTGRTYREVELLEIAAVPVPSNREALMKAAKLLEEPREAEQFKAVVPFKEYPLADVDRAWDGDAAVQRLIRFVGGPDKDKMDFERFRAFFTIWDPQSPASLTGYKLPHHDIINGQPRTVFRGAVAAIAAVNGARGGVSASVEERRLAHGHLSRHMREFDRKPPPFAARECMGASEIEAMRDYHLLMAEGFGLKVELKATDHLGEIERLRGVIEAIGKTLDERDRLIQQAVSAEVGAAVRQVV